MKIINPYYELKENNIFEIKQEDYDSIVPKAREMVKPAEELGFTLKEFGIKEARTNYGELAKTLKDRLKIIFEKSGNEIDLSILIPKLIDGQYVFINGRKKVPFFQLFDLPVISRNNSIKFRTNVVTAICTEVKNEPYISLSFLGKKIPLALLMYAYYGKEELNDRFELDDIDYSDIGESMYDKLIYDLKLYYDESPTYNQDSFINELGGYYTKYNIYQKGLDTVYAVDLINQTDILSYKFMNTENMIEEIIYAMNNPLSDIDIRNKRIRFAEYLVLSKVAKNIFDFCLANRGARKQKFNINQSEVITECNSSEIIQFDFSINPIDELTRLTRVSLLGPGGFDRDNVPDFLRDITPSMYGRICPVDTPDRDNCGVIQNIIPNTNLDDKYRFSTESIDQPISAPVSLVPFLEHDDQTRLQMAASQMRQSVLLRNFDRPLIKSGCEDLYTHKTQFLKKARKDGEIVYVDLDYIIVSYDDNDVDLFNISYRRMYVDNVDIYDVKVDVGDKVKAGDILAESRFCDDGSINFGKDLLTGVMIHYGNNYEDGIVVSDRIIKDDVFKSIYVADLSFYIPPDKVLLTLNSNYYKPLPEFGERVDPGQPYAITKNIPSSPNFDEVFKEPEYFVADRQYFITKCEVYANGYNDDLPEYKDFIERKIQNQEDNEENFKETIKNIFPKEKAKEIIKNNELNKFSQFGNYKMKGENIKGVFVKLQALYTRNIEVGDKIGNRHGNKGICTVIEEDKMPRLSDGRKLDICINPLGIISRMNIGQLFELNLGMAVMDLKEMTKDLINQGKQEEAKNKLINFVESIDNTTDNWYLNQFKEQLPQEINNDFVDEFSLIQPPFESATLDKVKEAMNVTGTEFLYDVYDPLSESWLDNKISVGYMYFFKLIHIAEDKLASRSLGSYNRRTLQPLGGRRQRGGQRLGEMEKACLVAHNAVENIHEFFTTKSDCIDLKDTFIKQKLEAEYIREKEISEVPESVRLLNAYMKVLGVNMDKN